MGDLVSRMGCALSFGLVCDEGTTPAPSPILSAPAAVVEESLSVVSLDTPVPTVAPLLVNVSQEHSSSSRNNSNIFADDGGDTAVAEEEEERPSSSTSSLFSVLPDFARPPFSDAALDVIAHSTHLAWLILAASLPEEFPDVAIAEDSMHYWETTRDAVLIDDTWDSSVCFVAFRGTLISENGNWVDSARDWWQNFSPESVPFANRQDPSQTCQLRRGFVSVFREPDYFTEFEQTVDDCLDQGKHLVFTGHSQGAAAALVAHFYFMGAGTAEQQIQSILLGQPPLFMPDTVCDYIPDDNVLRIVNSARGGVLGGGSLVYDLTPVVDLFQLDFWLGQHQNMGSLLLLPPAENTTELLYSGAELQVGSVLNIGVGAHNYRTYHSKIQYMRARGADALTYDGFAADWICNFDEECSDGARCVRRLIASVDVKVCCAEPKTSLLDGGPYCYNFWSKPPPALPQRG